MKCFALPSARHCDYHGCTEPLTPEQAALQGDGMRFCDAHDKDCAAAILGGARTIIRFWIKARGGPAAMMRESKGDIDAAAKVLEKLVKRSTKA